MRSSDAGSGGQSRPARPPGLSIESIARRSDTPKRFLEQIPLELRNAGMASSVRAGSHVVGCRTLAAGEETALRPDPARAILVRTAQVG